jgi:hypothetical protein
MIIWRGYGYLAFVIPVGGMIVVANLQRAIGGSIGMIIGIVGVIGLMFMTWRIGRKLNRSPTVVLDALGKREYYHDMFYIKLEYWPFIYCALGLVIPLCILATKKNG